MAGSGGGALTDAHLIQNFQGACGHTQLLESSASKTNAKCARLSDTVMLPHEIQQGTEAKRRFQLSYQKTFSTFDVASNIACKLNLDYLFYEEFFFPSEKKMYLKIFLHKIFYFKKSQ